ncbi:transmembrane protein 41B-like [Sycon ciliatum]|uniref:transmembrane protein 41B-like n=1 Tax=Sycon ciliatum TaxID=27933 RepID=UPI0020AD0682|eukprot:scpid82916/ scgid17686/ Transmembrane protein 41B
MPSGSLSVRNGTFSSQSVRPRSPIHASDNASTVKATSTGESTRDTGMIGKRRKSFLLLGALFAFSAGCLYLLFQSFPDLAESDKQHVHVPRTLDDAKELGRVLSMYTDTHFPQVVVGYACVYVFLQAFAIPGSIFLSVLSGYLFPFPLALFLVCLCSACGASACYLLSYLVLGSEFVSQYLPSKIEYWKAQISHYGWVELLSTLVFLRITPFLPNWSINIASPVIGFPLSIFFLGTFIGVAPPSALAVMSGTQLYELTSATELLTLRAVGLIGLIAVMALMPMAFKRLLGSRVTEQRDLQD